MGRDSKKLFREGDVIAVPVTNKDGTVEMRPALITEVQEKPSFTTSAGFDYAFIESDGNLGFSKHCRGYGSEVEGIKHIDLAKVRTVVDLPPEWQKVATDFDKRYLEERKKEAERMEEDEPESHPSYATIHVSRPQGGGTSLFMSPFTHQHYMTVSIRRAYRRRSLSNDWVFGEGAELIEVAMSEAQWAKFVSSAGMGGGTPCTMMRLGGSLVQECPQQADLHRFHDDVKTRMDKAAEGLTKAVERAEALLASKSATKAERAAVLAEISKVKSQLTDGLPFVAKQLQERMEHIVTEGKVEIDAYVNKTIQNAGLAHLNDGKAPVSLNLGPGKNKDGES